MANRFWVPVLGDGTGTWDNSITLHWSATSNGVGGQSAPVAGDVVTFDAASCPLGETVTVNADVAMTSLTMGAFTGTLDFSANNNSPTMNVLSTTGTGTRTLNMGSGTWNIIGNNGTVLSMATGTNLTISPTIATVNLSYSGGTGNRAISIGAATSGVFPLINVTAGTDGIVTATSTHTGFNFTGFTGTWTTTSQGAQTLFGDLTLGTGMTVTFNNTITFAATSGTKVIRSNNITLASSLNFNGVGGTWQLFDALSIPSANTITLTNGTFDANNKNVTCGLFSSSNSNTRVLTMGSGTWTLTGNAATIFSCSTSTGMTFTASTATINLTYSGATGTRTYLVGATMDMSNTTLNINAGTDTVQLGLTTGGKYGNINFTGFTGTMTGGAGSTIDRITGNITLGIGMTVTSDIRAWTFTGGTSINFTSNGVVFKRPFTVGGTGGTVTFVDGFAQDNVSTSILSLTAGTLNANNQNITTYSFSGSNSTTRTLTMGSGTWTLTGTGTVWNTATTTGLTLVSGASTIKITDTSANDNTFAGGGLTFDNLRWSRGASANSNIHTGSNTFRDLRDDGSAAHALLFTAGTTTTVASFTVSGTVGNLITVSSVTAATHNLVKTDDTDVASDYLSISYSVASPASTWYAGANSTNGGNNSGWIFSGPPVSVLLRGFLSKVGPLDYFRLSPVLKVFPFLSRINQYHRRTNNTNRR